MGRTTAFVGSYAQYSGVLPRSRMVPHAVACPRSRSYFACWLGDSVVANCRILAPLGDRVSSDIRLYSCRHDRVAATAAHYLFRTPIVLEPSRPSFHGRRHHARSTFAVPAKQEIRRCRRFSYRCLDRRWRIHGATVSTHSNPTVRAGSPSDGCAAPSMFQNRLLCYHRQGAA